MQAKKNPRAIFARFLRSGTPEWRNDENPCARHTAITGWDHIASLKSPKSWPFWKR